MQLQHLGDKGIGGHVHTRNGRDHGQLAYDTGTKFGGGQVLDEAQGRILLFGAGRDGEVHVGIDRHIGGILRRQARNGEHVVFQIGVLGAEVAGLVGATYKVRADLVDEVGLHVGVGYAFKHIGHIGSQVLDLLHGIHKDGVHERGFAGDNFVVEIVAAVEGGAYTAEEEFAAPALFRAVGQSLITGGLAGFQVGEKFIPRGRDTQAQFFVDLGIVEAQHGLTHGRHAIDLSIGDGGGAAAGGFGEILELGHQLVQRQHIAGVGKGLQPAVCAAHEHVGRAVAGSQRGGKDGVVLGILDGILNHFDVRVGGFEVRDYGVIECRVFGTPGPEGNFGHFLSQCGDRQHAHQQAQGNTNTKKLFHVEGLSFRFYGRLGSCLWLCWLLATAYQTFMGSSIDFLII